MTAPTLDVATTPAATPTRWLTGLGAGFVVLGGVVAAATGPLSLSHGSWLAAYLVLVCGVSQYAMGRVSQWLGTSPPNWTPAAGWNLGNALVIAGTLTTSPYLVDAGGVVVLAVLLTLLRAALRSRPDRARRWGDWAYLAMLAILMLSVPIGLVLAHLRAE